MDDSVDVDESSEQIDADECRTDAEREFVAAMSARALAWVPLGVRPSDVVAFGEGESFVLILDVCSSSVDLVLRTLRVEFSGDAVALGDDLTKQGHPLDPALQPVTTFRDPGAPSPYRGSGSSIERLAGLAADWVERELRRPIEEHVWERRGLRHRRYLLADTGELLSWSDSSNSRRPQLGPPDSIRLVRGIRSALT